MSTLPQFQETMHIDLGPARSWGERFPNRPTAFAAETPPAREVLAQSRTLKSSGAAGVATVGAAGVEVAQQALTETQGAILPLVPYLDTLRWLFITLALGGVAVTIYARVDDWKRGRRRSARYRACRRKPPGRRSARGRRAPPAPVPRPHDLLGNAVNVGHAAGE
jgi:hypothetical protein